MLESEGHWTPLTWKRVASSGPSKALEDIYGVHKSVSISTTRRSNIFPKLESTTPAYSDGSRFHSLQTYARVLKSKHQKQHRLPVEAAAAKWQSATAAAAAPVAV